MLARPARLALGLLLAGVPALASTPIPLGPQFQVNTDTTSGQFAEGVAMTPSGDFIVVWTSQTSATDPGGTDPNDTSIQAQRYAADGSPLGPFFQVDTATGFQGLSSVAAADDGDFVVAWSDVDSIFSPRPSLFEVMAQRYAGNGSPSGANFLVNSVTSGNQSYPSVGIASDGDFIVVWEEGLPLPGPRPIEGRLFDAAGSPLSGDFTIAASGEQSAVAAAANGDFTVVWESNAAIGSDTNARSVQARRYAANGSALGAAFQVNTYTTGEQRFPEIAVAPDGDLVVVWSSEGSAGTDTSDTSVQGQRFAADGSPVGGEFQVNTGTMGMQTTPSVATDAGGDFVVVWLSYPVIPEPGEGDIFGQHFAADGTPLGSEFQVDDYPTDSVSTPTVAAAGEGFVVVWGSTGSPGSDDSSYSVQARRFRDGVPAEVPSLSAPLAIACAVLLLTVAALFPRRASAASWNR